MIIVFFFLLYLFFLDIDPGCSCVESGRDTHIATEDVDKGLCNLRSSNSI